MNEKFNEFVEKLKEIKDRGFIKTHRAGNTGIGKTLEDLLGIEENNIPTPNCVTAELKSARKNAASMLTLLTKSPLPQKANSELLQKYGYASLKRSDKKELHTTVNALEFNQLKGKQGFKIDIKKDKLNLIAINNEILGYWNKEVLKKAFEKKYPGLLYVKAESKGKGKKEEFWFNEAWLLYGFSFENFIKLTRVGVIKIDIRIGQYPDGSPHDHGTGFRVLPDKLDLCFSHREKIM